MIVEIEEELVSPNRQRSDKEQLLNSKRELEEAKAKRLADREARTKSSGQAHKGWL